MPWHIEKHGDEYCVILDETEEVEGCHDTESDAKDHMAALYTNVEESESMNVIEQFITKMRETLEEILSPVLEEEAISINDTYNQVWSAAEETDPFVWINDLYHDDDGTMFAILASEGKLFRADVSVSDSGVTLGEWIEVKIDFPTVSQSRTTIRRQKDGSFRWFSISCSATLNRVGHIDSRALFDSMIEYAENEVEYPIRMFYHAGDQFRTGQCDFMGRDDYLLVTSGVYDDTELAQREVEARLADPEYWGDSIGFFPTNDPEMLEVTEGIEIPIYNEGICYEISTLPESQAASWMTATPTLKEVTRMLKGNQKEAFVKLFEGEDDPEAAADAWLEDNADTRNRAILAAEMVTRDAEVDTEVEAEVEVEAEERVDEPEEEEVETPTDSVIVMDDEAMVALAEQVTQGIEAHLMEHFNEAQEAQATRLTEHETSVTESLEEVATTLEAINARLDVLELDESKKREIWAEDLPSDNTVRLSYRPRQEVEEEPVDPKFAQQTETDAVAEETLAKFPTH